MGCQHNGRTRVCVTGDPDAVDGEEEQHGGQDAQHGHSQRVLSAEVVFNAGLVVVGTFGLTHLEG